MHSNITGSHSACDDDEHFPDDFLGSEQFQPQTNVHMNLLLNIKLGHSLPLPPCIRSSLRTSLGNLFIAPLEGRSSVMKPHLSSKTRISSPVLKVNSLSSAASKSYSARTFRASCPPPPLVQFGGSEVMVRGRVSACCCFCSCKDNSMAVRGKGEKREQMSKLVNCPTHMGLAQMHNSSLLFLFPAY